MYPSSFGNYATDFKVAENQSTDLEKNDLQIGVGTADNTGSSVEFSSMIHSMGIVNLTLGSKTVPSTRVFKPGSTSEKLFDRAPTTSITATSNFTASVASNSTNSYKKSTGIYLLVGKPSTTVTFTGNSSEKYTWNATYTFSKNTGNIKTATPSREYDNAGWGFDYTGAVQTFTAPVAGIYKLEVWGAKGYPPSGSEGTGGYSYGDYNITTNSTKLYICVGAASSGNTNSAYNNRTKGTPEYFSIGVSGGGATHIATTIRGTGELSYYYIYQNEVLIVAGGGGSAEWAGTGGYGGGTVGGYGAASQVTGLNGTGGQQNKGGTTHKYNSSDVITEAIFGVGGYGYAPKGYYEVSKGTYVDDYGTQGGGGWYGGGGASYAGCSGGGSGHIGTGVTGETIAGNTSFPSPSGGTEIGHSGNGYAIITQLSY